ncbi:hypothetical protein GGF32_002552 [Allomyces javanicus]|nr:hypothetical protein GGF32_002552 [Allomyces javanicus]
MAGPAYHLIGRPSSRRVAIGAVAVVSLLLLATLLALQPDAANLAVAPAPPVAAGRDAAERPNGNASTGGSTRSDDDDSSASNSGDSTARSDEDTADPFVAIAASILPPKTALDPVAPRLTDPRFDSYVVGVHSGIGTGPTRVPVQVTTFLQSVRHVVLVGDTDAVSVAGVDMLDVIRGGKYLDEAQARLDQAANDLKTDAENERRRLTKRNDQAKPKLGENKPDQNNDGWRGDANKFLPGLMAMHEAYPDAPWYIFVDDDSYLVMENLHFHLTKLDPQTPYYFGQAFLAGPCPGGISYKDHIVFAHGGAGIVLSNAGMKVLAKHADQCMVSYKTCWAGDVRVGHCMRDAGLPYKDVTEGNVFHNVAPHWTSYEFPMHEPCKRPVSWHHLTPYSSMLLQTVYRNAHARARSADRAQAIADKLASDRAVPKHWEVRDTDRARVQAMHAFDPSMPDWMPSLAYAPVTMADVWAVFVDGDPDAPGPLVDQRREGSVAKIAEVDAGEDAPRQCAAKCNESNECFAWNVKSETGLCQLLREARIPKRDEKGWATGIRQGAYKCDDPGL